MTGWITGPHTPAPTGGVHLDVDPVPSVLAVAAARPHDRPTGRAALDLVIDTARSARSPGAAA